MTAKEVYELRNKPQDHEEDIIRDWDAIGKVIDEALEKQIPKKVEIIKHTNRVPEEQDEPHCPVCCDWLGWGYQKDGFCKHCGQAIDWSDVNNGWIY